MSIVQHTKTLIELCKKFIPPSTIQTKDIEYLKSILQELSKYIEVPKVEIFVPPVCRVTINKKVLEGKNERIFSIKKLIYPPKCKATFGRANLEKENIFYSTLEPITALKEMNPQDGDLITFSYWIPCDKDISFIAVAVACTSESFEKQKNEFSIEVNIKHLNQVQKFDKIRRELIELTGNFLFQCFTKNVLYGNGSDYFLSAFLSNYLLNDLYKNADAIIYPSVQNKFETSNIAIKPSFFDKYYKLKEVEESIYTNTNPSFFVNIVTSTNQFDNDSIVWK